MIKKSAASSPHTLTPNTLAITFAPHAMTCSLFAAINERPLLKAYESIPLINLELEHGLLFNPSRIQTLIQKFVMRHNAQAMPVSYSLSRPLVHEEFVTLPTKNPSLNQFPIAHSPFWHWDSQYLYETDQGHMFYICGIPKMGLLQYQLLAINQAMDIQHITSERHALLHAYKAMRGDAFRTTQLANHLTARNNTIENLFSHDDLMRMLFVPSSVHVTPADTLALLTSCGLFFVGTNA